jgi:hypothetical protein
MRAPRINRVTVPRGWPLLALAIAALTLAPFARADQAIIPLHELIGSSSSVVIGTVQSVQPAKDPPGSFLLDVTVDETLVGIELDRLLLPASNFDPLLPAVLEVGTRVLVFVPEGRQVMTEGYLLPFAPNHPPDPVRELIGVAASSGNQTRLPAVQKFLEVGSGIPPELLGSLLESLTEAGAGGGPHVKALLEIACTSRGMYQMQAQLFALGELGEKQIADGRACLETTALETKNLSRQIAAVEALGNLGDVRSVNPLLSLIPALPPGAIAGLRGNEDFAPARANDPEDESDPEHDPDERSEGGEPDESENDPGEISRDGDGERELDFGSSDDEMLTRDAGGLVDAVVLALGKIGSPKAIPDLFRVAREGDDLSLHSTVVVALGMIGGKQVQGPLTSISKTHPNDLVRELASQTLARLNQSARR